MKTKAIVLCSTVLVAIGCLVTMVIRAGRETERKKAQLLLRGAYSYWDKKARPTGPELLEILKEYGGTVPLVSTNLIRIGDSESWTIFAYPRSVPGMAGRLCITTDGVVVLVDSSKGSVVVK